MGFVRKDFVELKTQVDENRREEGTQTAKCKAGGADESPV